MLWLSNLSIIKDEACNVMDKIQNEILPELQIGKTEFFSACEKKAIKNGLFRNKYVLLKTRFSGENMQNNEEATLPIIRSLSQKNERSIELLKSGDINTLLIRKKISMEYVKYTEVLANEKISSFFGKSSCINLFFEHKNNAISLNISRENIKEFMQFEFEF